MNEYLPTRPILMTPTYDEPSRAVAAVLGQYQLELPNIWYALGAALSFHWMLFMINPTIFSGSKTLQPPRLMQVEYRETLPPLVQSQPPKPVVKPQVKKANVKSLHKKVVKKAHKSGLTLTKPKPAAVAKVRAKPKPRVMAIPHYVPHSSDEPLAHAAASPRPAALPVRPAQAMAINPFSTPQRLQGKTRGVKISDVRFEMAESGTLSQNARGGAPVVAIPLGEESGDVAALPSVSPALHEAPGTSKRAPAYNYRPGEGAAGGELAGRNRGGYRGGVIRADVSMGGEVRLAGNAANAQARDIGGGVEIGGPVGDREVIEKILPEYPRWAEERNITALVKIYFTVKTNGGVRAAMRVLRSSGYAELDQLAKDALAQWKFSPTDASSSEQDAWGVITFHFTLN